jgi:hypothetical protein
MNTVLKFAALALALGAALSAQAQTSTWTPSPLAIEVVPDRFAGNLLQSFTERLSGNINGILRTAVYGSATGLDFYYQFVNGSDLSMQNASPAIRDVYLQGFATQLKGAPYSIYQTKAAFEIFTTGTQMAMSASQIMEPTTVKWGTKENPVSVDFSFSDNASVNNGIEPGQASFTEIIRTTGTGKYLLLPNRIDIVGNNFYGPIIGNDVTLASVSTSGFAPDVPEPETYAMLLAGLGLLGGIARRRKAKQA